MKHDKPMRKKEFVAATFDSDYEIFVIYIALPNFTPFTNVNIYLSCKP